MFIKEEESTSLLLEATLFPKFKFVSIQKSISILKKLITLRKKVINLTKFV